MSKVKNTITIVNSETGEQITREMTAEEIAEMEAIDAANASIRAEADAKEAARQSALEKLAALGLTADEITAIAGGN